MNLVPRPIVTYASTNRNAHQIPTTTHARSERSRSGLAHADLFEELDDGLHDHLTMRESAYTARGMSMQKNAHPTFTARNVQAMATAFGIAAAARGKWVRHTRWLTSKRPCQSPPRHEVVGGPVPDAGDREGHDQIDGRAALAEARTPERDVDVVADPAAERDVPASPELRDVSAEVRPVEVLGDHDAEQVAAADGDVGVRREVESRSASRRRGSSRRSGGAWPHAGADR